MSTVRYAFTFFRDYLQFHSLIIAICRYTFIIMESKAEKFGIARLRKYFIVTSISVPLFTSTIYELTSPIENRYIQWFYGIDDSPGVINSTVYFEESLDNEPFESVPFKTFNSFFPSVLVDSFHFIDTALFSIIYSNLIEGCLYAHLFIYYYR